MTRRASRPLTFLLVFLLVTWGTCPCVFAQMLGLGGESAGEGQAAEEGQAASQVEPKAPC